jgi:hypothetical protein
MSRACVGFCLLSYTVTVAMASVALAGPLSVRTACLLVGACQPFKLCFTRVTCSQGALGGGLIGFGMGCATGALAPCAAAVRGARGLGRQLRRVWRVSGCGLCVSGETVRSNISQIRTTAGS